MFDGYDYGPSTKYHEHHRRSLNKKGTAEVIFEESTKVRMKQETFSLTAKTNLALLTCCVHTYAFVEMMLSSVRKCRH